MTSSDAASAMGAVRGNLVIAAASVVAGAIVIPYGASMPYIREGIPGPGLFPMMIGGLLIIFGILLALTSLHGARRERRHLAELAAVHADGSSDTASSADGPTSADGTASTGASVPDTTDDAPAAELETTGVLDTDIGSDGIRRWINGAILMGGIVFYVLFAEILGFPLTMALLVFAIVWSLRAKWWVALATGVCASLGLWAMFELALMVQLPDGILKGF